MSSPVIIGDCTLYLGDCLEILPTLGKVDAVVTDPPYGVNFRGEGWDQKIPEWFPLAQPLASRLFVISGPTTMWDYPRPEWVACWVAPGSTARAKGGGFNHWCPIAVYGKVMLPVDTICLPSIANRYAPGEIDHPSPKPERLMDWLCTYAAAVDGTILDPFMGSGTTGVSCVRLARKFLGIEREPQYFDIACKRIADAYRQGDMFREPPKTPIQEALPV